MIHDQHGPAAPGDEEIDVPIQEAVRDLTLHFRISGVKGFTRRLWLAKILLRAAARVIGAGSKIEVSR